MPKILAAAVIAADPQRFGFEPPRLPPPKLYEAVALPSSANLGALAAALGIPVSELRLLNPDLQKGASFTPAANAERQYRLNVPAGLGSRLVEHWTTIAKASENAPRDTGQKLGRRGSAKRPAPAKRTVKRGEPGVPSKKTRGKYFIYRVAKGNNLNDIAKKFGVGSYRDLMRWNRLKRSTVYVGQKLRIYRPYKVVKYKVRKGDTLGKLEKKYRVKIQDLRFFNGIRRSLIAGRTLRVYIRLR